jgi:hypothetical protein
MLTSEQAQVIVEAHDILAMMENSEEAELLKENNPELYEAYEALLSLSMKQ